MKRNSYTLSIVILLAILSLTSCNKYLDVSDDFSASDSKAFIFQNVGQARRFQYNIYSALPDYSNYANPGTTSGLGNPWACMSDELKNNNTSGYLRDVVKQGYSANASNYHRWNELYKVIRTATVFIDSARVLGQAGEPDYIDQAELTTLKAECYFFRGYAHYLLFEQYGPIPIMKQETDPSDPSFDIARNSVDEIVAAIDADLLKAKEGLDENRFSTAFTSGFDENKLTRPTKGVALAVRAKLFMMAASPLYNGGYSEALTLTNKDGKKLFPVYDANKWVLAKNALKDLIDFAEAGNYDLYYSTTATPNDPNLNIYELFQRYNKEIIWATPYNQWSTMETAQTPRDITSTAGGGTGSYIGVTQEMVDAFFMNNGLSINDIGSGYSPSGFSNVLNPTTRFVKGTSTITMTDNNIFNMYANREPRFYSAVTYQGKSWHDVVSNPLLQGTNAATSKATKVLFSRDIPSSTNPLPGYGGIANNDNVNGGNPATGYLCYKNCNRTIHPTATSRPRSVFRPSIIFRLADFYLLYAEACNEVAPNDPNIIKYLDKVRVRAGIPGYAAMQSNGTKTGVIGDQIKQRSAIIKERQVELFTEGQRYFDVRRWMIADKAEGRQGGDFHGMNMDAATATDYFTNKVYETRIFTRSMYLYPIPLSEIQKSNNLVQNPGW